MFCQTCGARNESDTEYCRRCHQKLLVVSGAADEESYEEPTLEEAFSFDEHLLERISVLEEAVKRTTETVRQLLSALRKQERNILVNQTGLATVRELLEDKQVAGGEEWDELWKSKMDYQLLALEKRERFIAAKDRILALYHGKRRRAFLELLEDAEYALFAFDVDRAVHCLEEAYRLDDENYELAYFLGEVYFNESRSERALEYFSRVLEIKPDHYEGLVFSGVIYREQGDSKRAERFLKRAVSLYSDAFLPNFSLGAVYAGNGELSRAVLFLERAVSADPMPQALFLLGRCYYEMGKPSRSISALREAVRRDPAFEEAHHLLGLAYLDRRWNRKALESFRAAQRLNPRKLRYHDLVRYLSGQEGSPLPKVGAPARKLLKAGEERLRADDAKGAQQAYQRALALEPENPTLLMSYAMLCLQLDRSQEIEAVTRKVLDSDPPEMLEATAYATLIAALRSQGKYREGNRIGAELVREERSNFTKTIAYYEMAYNLAEMEEDLDRALDYARRSLELSPEELRQFPLAALGWVHYKRKELDQAIDCLSRSADLGSSATTLTHLGMALLAAGAEDEARGVLAHADSLDGRGEALEEKMMAFLKDSSRLAERVEQRKK
jgi:tetratricopeptide (TPR) repeat protein